MKDYPNPTIIHKLRRLDRTPGKAMCGFSAPTPLFFDALQTGASSRTCVASDNGLPLTGAAAVSVAAGRHTSSVLLSRFTVH